MATELELGRAALLLVDLQRDFLHQDGALESTVCVAVGSDEAPPELAREADLAVDGPAGVRGLLEALL